MNSTHVETEAVDNMGHFVDTFLELLVTVLTNIGIIGTGTGTGLFHCGSFCGTWLSIGAARFFLEKVAESGRPVNSGGSPSTRGGRSTSGHREF